jgi:hypothetical protein
MRHCAICGVGSKTCGIAEPAAEETLEEGLGRAQIARDLLLKELETQGLVVRKL